MLSLRAAGLCLQWRPFPLALFLISGNHIPFLLHLTCLRFHLSPHFLGERMGRRGELNTNQPNQTHLPDLLPKLYSGGASHPHFCFKAQTPDHCPLCTINIQPCRVPSISTDGFGCSSQEVEACARSPIEVFRWI